MASVENAGGASPHEQEAAVPRASPGIDDMLEEAAAAEPPRHVRRISDSEALDAAAASATQDTKGGADSDDIRPSGGSPGSGRGDDNNKVDGANRGVEAILKVAASTDEGDAAAAAAAASTTPKSVSPLRPRPHRPSTADGANTSSRSKGEKGLPPPQRIPPGMPPPPPGGYPGPSGAYHHPYGPPPYYCK